MSIDWTQVLLAAIAAAGSAVSAYYAYKSKSSSGDAEVHAAEAKDHADRAAGSVRRVH